jgi:hypothetical protein
MNDWAEERAREYSNATCDCPAGGVMAITLRCRFCKSILELPEGGSKHEWPKIRRFARKHDRCEGKKKAGE